MSAVQSLRRGLCVLYAAVLTGCATLDGTITETVGQSRVEYVLTRHGPPTVVFENGLGGTLNWWAKVYPVIAKDRTAFAYNRPGYGDSETVDTPRDGMHVVEELRALLRCKELKPPYVLVGHSLGGLYLQWFARRYPDDVAALILVDSTHPEQLKGQGSPEHWPAWARWGFTMLTSDVGLAELEGIDATGAAVLTLPTLKNKPVIILSAAQPLNDTSDLAKEANAKRKDLARLYPGATQVWVDSGHGIPLEKPEAVIEAIREALERMPPARPTSAVNSVPAGNSAAARH